VNSCGRPVAAPRVLGSFSRVTNDDAETRASDHLRNEFAGVFPAETVDDVFRSTRAELAAAARVHNFVPMLAERRTRERLSALAHT
jgi:hypothetical protein